MRGYLCYFIDSVQTCAQTASLFSAQEEGCVNGELASYEDLGSRLRRVVMEAGKGGGSRHRYALNKSIFIVMLYINAEDFCGHH